MGQQPRIASPRNHGTSRLVPSPCPGGGSGTRFAVSRCGPVSGQWRLGCFSQSAVPSLGALRWRWMPALPCRPAPCPSMPPRHNVRCLLWGSSNLRLCAAWGTWVRRNIGLCCLEASSPCRLASMRADKADRGLRRGGAGRPPALTGRERGSGAVRWRRHWECRGRSPRAQSPGRGGAARVSASGLGAHPVAALLVLSPMYSRTHVTYGTRP